MSLRSIRCAWLCRAAVVCGPGGLAEGDFERRLTAQASTMVSEPHIAGETRRGRDYLRVTIVMTVVAADVGQAAVIAWRVFRRAAGDGIAGWDLAGASAEVSPPPRGGEARR